MTRIQKKKADGRYEGANYRHSMQFIDRATKWLAAGIFIGLGLGLGLYLLGYYVLFTTTFGPKIPEWYSFVSAAFALGGIVIALIVGAWLGGNAINKYGGFIGLLLVFGIGVTAIGSLGKTAWFWVGVGMLVLSTLLFFYIGFKAKVPMWLQLPILNSPRLHLRRDGQSKKAQVSKKRSK